MSWFTKFDSWVKSIGDKTIKPVAKVGVYVTSTLFGNPGLGTKVTDAWDSQEQRSAQQSADNLATVQRAQAVQKITDWIKGISSGTWYFIGFLILLYIVFTNNKKKKR
jgi:hypothetical protein